MADQPQVQIDTSPGAWNLAYGPNVVTLSDANTTNPKFALQVFTADGLNKVAEVRQQSNLQGRAHFDIGKILQAQVTGYDQLAGEQIDIVTAPNEVFEYQLKAGFVGTTGVTNIQAELTDLKIINGRKRFDNIDWDVTPYQAKYELVLGFNVRRRQADWLTDWGVYKSLSSFTDGVPLNLIGDTKVYTHQISTTDYWTLSAINQLEYLDAGTTTFNRPIGQFRIVSYDGSTLLDDITIENLLANGGGPNYLACLNSPNEAPYWGLSFPCGPAQLNLTANWTHYYVYAQPLFGGISSCNPGTPQLFAHRFDRYDGECNDYSHVQVNWLNSLGFRDYFSFDKRHDQDLSIKRNNYNQLPGTWNASSFNINNWDRGRRVFSQEVEETWTLTSRYLTEDEYAYLKNMILSPDIQVRFEAIPEYDANEWMAATIETNRWRDIGYRKEKLFQMEVTIKIANNIETQRG